jgi:hypothetical protein
VSGGKIETNEMGRACGAYGGGERCAQGVGGIFRKLEGFVGTGWSWLRIGTGGGHLWVR